MRWKVALGIRIEDHPFAKSTLQLFRAQLVTNGEAQGVFRKSLALATKKGFLRKNRKLRAALDTTNILGRGAVKDTYNLLGDVGRQKTLFQLLMAATVANLTLLASRGDWESWNGVPQALGLSLLLLVVLAGAPRGPLPLPGARSPPASRDIPAPIAATRPTFCPIPNSPQWPVPGRPSSLARCTARVISRRRCSGAWRSESRWRKIRSHG